MTYEDCTMKELQNWACNQVSKVLIVSKRHYRINYYTVN